jgi:CTP:molybdopterin cytidylyltransferase MocA/HD superfamily phosphohydrolase YqeK
MEAFKPLLPLCGTTVIGNVISTLRSAGADHIIVVTGFEAERLQKALDPFDVEYVYNSDYATSPMFSSARIGLEAVQKKSERIFFTPADIPLFTGETLLCLLGSAAAVTIPTHLGRPGHPALFDSRIIPELLNYPAEGSLREAITACSGPLEYLEVTDPGVLIDTDTPAEYALVRLLAGELPEGSVIPKHITAHMQRVAKLATSLGALLNSRAGYSLDLFTLELAARLHDIRRTEPHHAECGAQTLLDAGHPRLAELVRQHMLPSEAEWERVSEITVLYLADKMADGDRVVSIEERYAKRLTTVPDGAPHQAVERNFSVAMAIKSRMEAIIGETICPELLHHVRISHELH